jgi:beta-ribofuranosylaminobenzene 5'-phosphate synthase
MRLRDCLNRIGADCVGMSSLGPMLFCLGRPSTLDGVVGQQHSLDCDVFYTIPDNSGRLVWRAHHA